MGLPIQNIRSSTASKRPTASNLLDGQIALNYEESDPGIYLKGSSGSLVKVAPHFIGSAAPNNSPGTGGSAGNSKGETWVDTSTTPATLKVFNGSAFVELGTFTDLQVKGIYKQDVVAVSGTAIDLSQGNYFTKTITSATTFSFTNVPTSCAYSFTIEIEHNTTGAVSWPSAVQFSSVGAPTLSANKTTLFMFVTDNGGGRWRAAALHDFTT